MRLVRFCRCFVLAALGLVVGEGPARELETDVGYQEVLEALAMGVNGVAALKAEALREEEGWSEDQQKELAGLVAEGWLRAGQPERVLSSLEVEPRPHGGLFWRGQAHLLLGDLAAAEEVLSNHGNAGRNEDRARLALANVYLAAGREASARSVLKEIRESVDPYVARRARLMFNESELQVGRAEVVLGRLEEEGEANADADDVRFLRARSLFQLGRTQEALELIGFILRGTAGGERLHHATKLLEVEILLAEDRVEEGYAALMAFMATLKRTDFWAQAFELLRAAQQWRIDAGIAELPPAVVAWAAADGLPIRQQYALFLLGDWLSQAGRMEEGAGFFEAVLAGGMVGDLESETLQRAMEVNGQLGADERVLALADRWRQKYGGGDASMVDFIAGGIFFARGDYEEAVARFLRSADLTVSLTGRRKALFNAAVAALKTGEQALFGSLLGQLQVVSAVEDRGEAAASAGAASGVTVADLELDRAIELAARDEREGLQLVEAFLAKYPDHPRWPEAQLVLADLCLLDVPPRVKAAEVALTAGEKKLPVGRADLLQRLRYTRLWCREAEQDWDGVVSVGLEFLTAWPEAELAAQVEMKVADAYYRQEDFANALTHFELVSRNYAQSEFAEAALFFAGKSALNLMSNDGVEKAIELWEEVAALEGELAFSARLQQAIAKRRQGKEAEAIQVIEALLAEPELALETRWLLICEKAELHQLLGAEDSKELVEAKEWLKAFLASADLPYAWLARGGYLLAYCQRELGEKDQAIVTCYDVVNATGYEVSNPSELQWFYRAGFLAVELLEEGEQWEGAARMAERMASTVGERATEAKDRATKIRLDHFLWEEKK